MCELSIAAIPSSCCDPLGKPFASCGTSHLACLPYLGNVLVITNYAHHYQGCHNASKHLAIAAASSLICICHDRRTQLWLNTWC